jgi:ABC-type lipoprotein export system ATPase subunit
LVHKPELVTADEPTSALDVAHGEDTFAMMREISQTEGTSFLIVTHNEHVKDYVDNNIHMIDGQVVETTLPTGPIDVDFLRHK